MRDLIPLLIAHGGTLVFCLTLLSRLGAPLPAAPLLVLVGAVAMAGQLSLVNCMTAAIAANILGDAVWYQAGRWRGYRVMKLLCKISLSPDTCVRQSEGVFSRWGGTSLVAAKFLPGMSVIAAPMAGALGMSWPRFLSYDALGAFIWSALFVSIGVLFRAQIASVLDVMTQAGTAAVIVVAAVLCSVLAYRYAKRWIARSDRFGLRITVTELRELIRRGEAPVVIDVRSQIPLFKDGPGLPGALALTLGQLPQNAAELPRDRDIVLYCSCPNEVSAVRGARILGEHGLHRARALKGGLEAWIDIETTSPLGQTPEARAGMESHNLNPAQGPTRA